MTAEEFKSIDKLSTLLRVAIDDLEIVRKLPGYVIDMGAWHSPREGSTIFGECHVCMAGAVMAGTLGIDKYSSYKPESFDKKTHGLLEAIDCLRCGQIVDAFSHAFPERDIPGVLEHIDVGIGGYDRTVPNVFFHEMEILHDNLIAAGY